MKKILSILIWTILILSLINCRGPEGPPGPQGAPGPEGLPGPFSLLYEVEYPLNPNNDWSYLYQFPTEDLDLIYPEDAVLVYLLVDEIQNDQGQWMDVWRLMPIMYFEEEGLFTFNYDYTLEDVSIFAEANFLLDDKPGYNLVSRIVIVPADWAPNARTNKPLNYENYEEVIEALGIPNTKSTGTPLSKIKAK